MNYKDYSEIRLKVLERDNNQCVVCGTDDDYIKIHHIIPKRFGGLNTMSNLITVCHICHANIHGGDIGPILEYRLNKINKTREWFRMRILELGLYFTKNPYWNVPPKHKKSK